MEHHLEGSRLCAPVPCKFGAVRVSELARGSRSRSYLEFAPGYRPIPSAREWRWRETACHQQVLDPPSSSWHPESEARGSAPYAETGTLIPRDRQSRFLPSPALPVWSGLHASLV